MPDIRSADRASILTELILMQNNLIDGNITPASSTIDAAYNISDLGAEYIAEHGDNQQEILEQVFHGSYGLDDLHGVIKNAVYYAGHIDGDLNTASILMLSHMEEIQQLTSEQPIDHSALFKEVAKLGVVAQASELMNSVSGIVSSEDRNHDDIAQFNANLQAMSVIVLNIAQENGVDIHMALRDVQQELSVGNNTAEAEPVLQPENRFSFKRYVDEPVEKRSLRPTGALSGEDRSQLLDEIGGRYDMDSPQVTDTSANSEQLGASFLKDLEKTLSDTASELRNDSIRSGAGPYGYFNLWTVSKLQDIEEVKGHWSTKSFKNSTEEWLHGDKRPNIQLDDAIKQDEHADFRMAIGQNLELQERLINSITLQEPDYDDLRQQWIGVVDYYEKYGTLSGAESIMDIDAEHIKLAIENGSIHPPENMVSDTAPTVIGKTLVTYSGPQIPMNIPKISDWNNGDIAEPFTSKIYEQLANVDDHNYRHEGKPSLSPDLKNEASKFSPDDFKIT